MYKIMITKQAIKDTQMLEQAGLKMKAISLLKVIQQNPYQNPPPFEKLKGCADTYSRRVNIHHRLVYQVLEPVLYLAFVGFLSELTFLLGITDDTRIINAFLLGGADTAERKIRQG